MSPEHPGAELISYPSFMRAVFLKVCIWIRDEYSSFSRKEYEEGDLFVPN